MTRIQVSSNRLLTQQSPAEPSPPRAARLSLRKPRPLPAHTASQRHRAATPRVSSTCGAPGGDIIVAGSSIQPCPRSVPTPMMPKMSTGTRRIPAVPGSQKPRSDLVEARGSNPCRILLRQRTLSVHPLTLCLFPGMFSLESFPWKAFPGKFSLDSSDVICGRSKRSSGFPETP